MKSCSLEMDALGCGTVADCQVGCNCDCGFAWSVCNDGDSGWNCTSTFEETCQCTMSGLEYVTSLSRVSRNTVESCELNSDAVIFCGFVECYSSCRPTMTRNRTQNTRPVVIRALLALTLLLFYLQSIPSDLASAFHPCLSVTSFLEYQSQQEPEGVHSPEQYERAFLLCLPYPSCENSRL
jgi:hypothetical protein